MKGKRVIAGILLVGILVGTLTGCKTQMEVKRNTKTCHHALEATVIHHTII